MDRHSRAFTFTFVLCLFVLLVSSATDGEPASETKVVDAPAAANSETQTRLNETHDEKDGSSERGNCTASDSKTECVAEVEQSFVSRVWNNLDNRNILYATMGVLLGITGIAGVYVIVKAIRLHRRRTKSRKYGVITTQGDLEMEPLGQSDDDDEDLTVFEMNGRSK